jgi:site-specific DNA-methyltransferase (adenine-specific)
VSGGWERRAGNAKAESPSRAKVRLPAADPTPWLAYPQVILWGAHHYAHHLQAAGGWLVWDKRGDLPSNAFSDAELAWTNLRTPVRSHTQKWSGIIREGEANVSHRGKYHPAEKPIELMQWCVRFTTGCVLDPYMGSGSTGVACVLQGRAFVGIEIVEKYFQTACERLQEASAQGTLFPAPAHPTTGATPDRPAAQHAAALQRARTGEA